MGGQTIWRDLHGHGGDGAILGMMLEESDDGGAMLEHVGALFSSLNTLEDLLWSTSG